MRGKNHNIGRTAGENGEGYRGVPGQGQWSAAQDSVAALSVFPAGTGLSVHKSEALRFDMI